MRTFLRLSPLTVSVVVGFFAWAAYTLAGLELLSPRGLFTLLTLLLLGYIANQILRARRMSPGHWLINPAVLCSIVIFAIGLGLGNLLYIYPPATLESLGLAPQITVWMCKLMALGIVAAVGMWLGYWSTAAERLARSISTWRWLQRVLRRDFDVRTEALVVLFVASLVSRLTLVNLGVYGYSANYERLMETVAIRQYLSLVSGLGLLALIVAAFRYYSPQAPASARWWLVGLLAYEVGFGFLSGFKSQVAMPLVVVGMCQYLRIGRVPWRWVALFPLAVIAAYTVIEPFRGARQEYSALQSNSVANIAGTMLEAVSEQSTASAPDVQRGTELLVLARMSTTYIASLGIEFADSKPLPEGSPGFLSDIFLSPLYALIPRAIWPTKESSRHGVWYWNEVMGIDDWDAKTSVGMSPFTYLYFAGGGLAVALGFFFMGMLQRAWMHAFLRPDVAGALLVFLLGLRSLVMIDSVYYSTFIDLLRFTPGALLLQYLIFRR